MTGAGDPLAALFARAGHDGHTWLPESVVAGVVPSAAMAAAAGAGGISRVPDGWALAAVAEAEDLLADALAGLVGEGRLVAVDGPAGDERDRACQRLVDEAAPRGATVTAITAADRLALDALLDAVEELDEDALLLLAGDSAALPPPGPGDAFADLVRSGACPVVTVPPTAGPAGSSPPGSILTGSGPAGSAPPGSALERLRAGLRDGRVLPPDPADRSFVVVPVTTDAQAAHRATQVASVSIPRAFGFRDASLGVVTPLVRGEAGRDALAAALPVAAVMTVHEAAGGRWPAVVLVLPPTCAGVLDRSLLVSAAALAGEHLTVIHGVGPDLARAVADIPRRPRRTRLAALLRTASVAGAADPAPERRPTSDSYPHPASADQLAAPAPESAPETTS